MTPSPLPARLARVQAVSDTYPAQKDFAEAIGMSESRVSKALSKEKVTERKLAPLEAAITDRGLWGRIGSAWKPPVVTPKRDEATEDPLNPPGPRAPVLPAILFVLRSNNGPAVGWDVNSGRFVQVGEPGHLDVVPKAATADGASSPADGAPTGTAAPASSAA